MLTIRDLEEKLPGLPVFAHAPMSEHTTFRIGGPADLLAMPRSEAELAELLALARERETAILVMGRGANLLVSDDGVRGLVIKTLPGLSGLSRRGTNELIAEAGVPLYRLAEAAADFGLSGLAFAHGIPGTVGGALSMNAGAYWGEMSQVVREVHALSSDGRSLPLGRDELDFSYRHSYFSDNPAIVATRAVLELSPGNKESIRGEMERLSVMRASAQPLGIPSAGSVFKRPPGHYAGKLIQDCGLLGAAVGGAQVSEKHAGFILNRGGATCDDVKRLIARIQRQVLSRTGVALECELRYIGG